MRVQFFPEIIEEHREDYALVIDVYRATSNIITLFAKNAAEIHLMDSKIKNNDEFIYVGEENGLPIDGFDYTNSPVQIQNIDFSGKKIKLKTTNGTKLIRKLLSYYKSIFPLSFLNFYTLKDYLQKNAMKFDIYCAGNGGDFSLEDALCGLEFYQECFPNNNDYSSFLKHLKMSSVSAKKSHHADRLISLGFGEDVEFCLNYDFYNVVCATDKNGVLRKMEI